MEQTKKGKNVYLVENELILILALFNEFPLYGLTSTCLVESLNGGEKKRRNLNHEE